MWLSNHNWIQNGFSLQVTNLGTNITDPFWADCNLGSDEGNFSDKKQMLHFRQQHQIELFHFPKSPNHSLHLGPHLKRGCWPMTSQLTNMLNYVLQYHAHPICAKKRNFNLGSDEAISTSTRQVGLFSLLGIPEIFSLIP